ncbi:hypothetical protein GOB94_10755 [Granulicella sp. 5B5]|uniref:hypothetical protein n=1 Tax=Granulicella sp. 5B5 TaxID=1617967 RepID=UPI0015F6CAEC|nr:hypothetical protein [Granulicella sp. 5B5]QMV19105.1 hypothetical protein GOB94_10755 [Granulicella sp. 5B5]
MNLDDPTYRSLLRDDAPTLINMGTGEDISIADLARLILQAIGFSGELVFDITQPDGTPRKLLDVTRIHALGWRHKITLQEWLRCTCDTWLNRAQL